MFQRNKHVCNPDCAVPVILRENMSSLVLVISASFRFWYFWKDQEQIVVNPHWLKKFLRSFTSVKVVGQGAKVNAFFIQVKVQILVKKKTLVILIKFNDCHSQDVKNRHFGLVKRPENNHKLRLFEIGLCWNLSGDVGKAACNDAKYKYSMITLKCIKKWDEQDCSENVRRRRYRFLCWNVGRKSKKLPEK